MKMMRWLLSLCLLPCAFAQQAPWARPDTPISSQDRVYAADCDIDITPGSVERMNLKEGHNVFAIIKRLG